jgi:ATP-dependent DNA helicase RecQ
MPRIFANSILAKNAQDAIDKINISKRFEEKLKEKAIRIIKKLFSNKSRKLATDETAEGRVDYISDHLGIVKEEVINIINLLREEKILADTKDLTAFIKKGENINRSLSIVRSFCKIEIFLFTAVEENEKTFHIKELNEEAEQNGCNDVTPNKINILLNSGQSKIGSKNKTRNFQKIMLLCCVNNTKKYLRRNLTNDMSWQSSLLSIYMKKSVQMK